MIAPPDLTAPALAPARADLAAVAGPDAAGLRNLENLILLRWIAVVGQVVTIAIVHVGFGIALPLPAMAAALALLVAFNIASALRWRARRPVTDRRLFVALLVDVAALAVQLALSGGATNPFVFLFLLQVILGAVLLQPRTTWALVVVTTACIAAIALWYRPLAVPLQHDGGLRSPYIQGLLLCFALNAALLVVFVTRINRNQRERDARLAALRQHAAEEEHIVRMGLLASGAAHELGSPLSTLSVILGDWRRMPPFEYDADLRQDLEEMQGQVLRCKSIVSGILMSAGEARGESIVATSVHAFMDDVVAAWRLLRPTAGLDYRNRFGDDIAIAFDTAIRQMVFNVLDNAFEAAPAGIVLTVRRDNGVLVLRVDDGGPGFDTDMLAHVGKPYRSSKLRPGGGLGLFLAVNVTRRLGGGVVVDNRPEGGASVTMRLPLSALAIHREPAP